MAANRNEDIDSAATVAHKILVGTLLTLGASVTGRVLKFRVPFDIEILSVETDNAAITGAPTVDVLAGATSCLAAPVALVNGAAATATLHATKSRRIVRKNTAIVVNAIDPAAASITSLTVAVTYRPVGLRGAQK